PHPETAPIYDDLNLGHCPALLRSLKPRLSGLPTGPAAHRSEESARRNFARRSPPFLWLAEENEEIVKAAQRVNHPCSATSRIAARSHGNLETKGHERNQRIVGLCLANAHEGPERK